MEELPTGFVGRAPAVVRIRGQIEKIGAGRSPVLILGESGTGKEVAARSIYNVRPAGQFVPIDCGSLVGPLMESELFGHTRNAFTGAQEAKRGLIELANGGTAFFDEIGDLPLELQVKLLRVLQERELRPVGSLNRVKVDIRVLAATHRNLEREVAAGRFREDLYHRLNVIRINLPPLRERKEDIPLLIERFLAQTGGHYVIANEALDAMLSYDWPGNIRELKNCLERMTALNSGPLLHFMDLPSNVVNAMRGGQSRGAAASSLVGPPEEVLRTYSKLPHPEAMPAIVTLEELERRAIVHALDHTRGDRTVAAQLLGIGRTTLYRKLKDYGIGVGGPPR